MRKCVCGGYERAGQKNDLCPRCGKYLGVIGAIDTAGFELVDVADPIFTEEDDYWTTTWLKKYHGVEYAQLSEPAVLDAPMAFVESKPRIVVAGKFERYIDKHLFDGNICDITI